jgi:hypothetical protein
MSLKYNKCGIRWFIIIEADLADNLSNLSPKYGLDFVAIYASGLRIWNLTLAPNISQEAIHLQATGWCDR